MAKRRYSAKELAMVDKNWERFISSNLNEATFETEEEQRASRLFGENFKNGKREI